MVDALIIDACRTPRGVDSGQHLAAPEIVEAADTGVQVVELVAASPASAR
jgi:hypothetical protein